MKTQTIKNIFSLLIIILLSNVLSAQTNYSSLKEKYSEKITKIMKKKKIPGASIALIDGNTIVWQQGFGFADEENEIKATPETLFKIGSVSKLFTGSAVMQLQEQGKLDLDDPVKKYITNLNMKSRFNQDKPFTVRQVLTHHAGIPSDIMKGFFSYKPESYETIVNYLNEEYVCYPPDYIHSYSNPGFTLMGVLVERVSGEKYPEYMRNQIFKPLGMENTCFWAIDKDVETMSKTYDRKGKDFNAPKLRDVPAGSIWSNVAELSGFLKEMIPSNNQNNILKQETKKEIFEVQNKTILFDVGDPIGIVWEINEETKAGTIYNHGGATMAHRAMVAVAPETSLGVAILTNTSRGGSVIGLYKEILEAAAEIKGVAKKIESQEAEKKIETKKLADDAFKDYQGIYAIPGVVMDLEKKRGKLQTKVQGLKLQFMNIEDNEFLARVKLLGFIGIKMKTQRFYFDEIAGEKVMIQGSVKSGNKAIAGQKVENTNIPDAWKARIGKYKILNQGDFKFVKSCELKEKNGLLVLSLTIKMEKEDEMNLALGFENDKLAYALGLGRHGGQALRVIEGEDYNELLYYSGYKMKKIDE